MKKLLLLLALSLASAFAASNQRDVEVLLIAHVEEARGKYIPQRGIRIYQDSNGGFYCVPISNGAEQRELRGGSDFEEPIRAALAELPMNVANWNREIDVALEKARKAGTGFGVLDGWQTQIRVTTKRGKIDFVRDNAGAYVTNLGDYSVPVGKLKRLLDVIALALGREQMAI